MKKILLNILRVVVSVGLLLYLIYLADFKKIVNQLIDLDAGPILLAMLAFLMAVVSLSFRWQVLIKAHGINTSFTRLFVIYFIGYFFNNFLPTSIGGDLSRAYYLGQYSGNRAAGLGTVFLERVIGLLATLSLAGFSLVWLTGYFKTNRIIYITLFLAGMVALFLTVVMSRRLYNRFTKLLSYVKFYELGYKISRVFDILHFYRDKKKVLAGAYFFSLMSQFMLIVMNYIFTHALHLDQISFGYLFLVVPVTFVFSLFPSINGIGVRDSGYMLLLIRQGLEPAEVLSLSFLATAIPILLSVIGGAFFLFYRHQGIKTPPLKEEKLL